MRDRILVSKSEAETQALGQALASELAVPATVLLYGELGAGKTALTKGLADGLGIDDPTEVHSPSFSLVNQYACRACRMYHIDLYRLETLKDLYSIGIEEILADEAVTVIEWAEKLRLPVENPIEVHFRVLDGDTREIVVKLR